MIAPEVMAALILAAASLTGAGLAVWDLRGPRRNGDQALRAAVRALADRLTVTEERLDDCLEREAERINES